MEFGGVFGEEGPGCGRRGDLRRGCPWCPGFSGPFAGCPSGVTGIGPSWRDGGADPCVTKGCAGAKESEAKLEDQRGGQGYRWESAGKLQNIAKF